MCNFSVCAIVLEISTETCILLSDSGTHGCSISTSEASELDIIGVIFVIFGGMVHQNVSSNELQNELDSTNSFQDIEKFSFLVDHPS